MSPEILLQSRRTLERLYLFHAGLGHSVDGLLARLYAKRAVELYEEKISLVHE